MAIFQPPEMKIVTLFEYERLKRIEGLALKIFRLQSISAGACVQIDAGEWEILYSDFVDAFGGPVKLKALLDDSEGK